ncbi:Phage tail protein [Lentilactobacillus parabuchneri]|uniref:phage tail tube protein n=2 Tax=Lentilactobacillus parabuchneri TaxID=152331 RepID=UPI000A107818|nr:phage tail tube protein [Lentilactobacillus parabuchneri]ORN05397.1 Phage tail protein [Lentilactobacillus parabuchneri]ORN39600.1 Phage tail protein [Lentilactobacillus parabuchneri]
MKKINLYSDKLNLQRFAGADVDSTQGLVATGTKLEMAQPGDTTTYTEVADVKTIPALGGSPQEVDVTTLADTRAKQIEGIEAATTAAFSVQYKGPSWNAVEAKAGDRQQYNWRVTYPDGMVATFTGSFTIQFGEVAVNGALTYTITVTISDGPNFTTSPSTGASSGK